MTRDTVEFGSLVLAGLPDDSAAATLALPRPELLAGERPSTLPPPPTVLLKKTQVSVPTVWQNATTHITALAAQLVWRSLASSETEEDDSIVLTFYGYKKASFVLPEAHFWETRHVAETLVLRQWALHDASPDRLLSVRQVVSLYDLSEAPFAQAADVQGSAEVIYVGLGRAGPTWAMPEPPALAATPSR